MDHGCVVSASSRVLLYGSNTDTVCHAVVVAVRVHYTDLQGQMMHPQPHLARTQH